MRRWDRQPFETIAEYRVFWQWLCRARPRPEPPSHHLWIADRCDWSNRAVEFDSERAPPSDRDCEAQEALCAHLARQLALRELERLLALHEDNPGQEMGILKCRDLSALRDVARPSLGVSVAGESIDLSSLSPTTLAELDAAASAARKRSGK